MHILSLSFLPTYCQIKLDLLVQIEEPCLMCLGVSGMDMTAEIYLEGQLSVRKSMKNSSGTISLKWETHKLKGLWDDLNSVATSVSPS